MLNAVITVLLTKLFMFENRGYKAFSKHCSAM